MALHEVQLKGYSVRPGNLSLGTFDSYGIEQLHVTADDSWDGLDILAVFHAPNGDAKKVVVGADGMLNVLPEATAKQAGNGRIVFVGLAENVQRITVDMGYNIKPHSDIEGDNPGVPTPDVVQQILGNSNHAVSIATAAQVSAENARRAAEDAAKKAGEEAGGAAYSAAAAKKSAEDAAASSKIAAGKAEASESSANVANESAEASQAAQSSAESSAQSAAKSARAAADSAASIVGAQEQSAASANAARDFAQHAKKASDSADASASASKEAATQAIESSTSAADSAADAEAAKTAAAESATAAAKSAADADSTANSIKDSMTQIAANKEAINQLEEDTAALKKRQNVLIGSETGNPASCDEAFAAPLCGLTVYGKSTQDGTPTLDAPVPIVSAGDSGSVAVKVTGKNLLTPFVNAHITVTSEGLILDGTIPQHVMITIPLLAGTYTFGDLTQKTFVHAYINKQDSNIRDTHTRVITATDQVMLYVAKGTYSKEIVKPYIVFGKVAPQNYEPYREQLLTLPTPNGLPGIPVISNGNYTDPSGQQWICDEVDLERGMMVQRVNKVEVDGETVKFVQTGDYANISTRGLPIALYDVGQRIFATSTFTELRWFFNTTNGQFLYLIAPDMSDKINESCKKQLGKIYYVLATPIETPLTPAEIAAYKAITAYAPDTVVQASDGAGIKLDYQRDVNLVVKNLEDAIASMTTT